MTASTSGRAEQPSARTTTTRGGPLLRRATGDRVIGGVAAGLGMRLGVDAMLVRITFVATAFAGGFGLLVYGALWALVPAERAGEVVPRRPASTQQSVALGLIVLGVMLLLRAVGLWFGDAIGVPILVAAAGSAIVWTRGDEQAKARWSRATPLMAGARHDSTLRAATDVETSPLRVAIGTVFVAVAAAGFLAATDAFNALWELGLALVASLVGVALLFGPWLYRLVQQLTVERRERIRQEERAEVAAHLHDSVLQTLALIQRSAHDPARMVGLARRQERELRGWLYTQTDDEAPSLDRALRAIADDVETHHAVNVEVIVVGDCPVDDALRALLGAVREACVNAAKHSGVSTIDVFAEVETRRIVAFVRDRGSGFDPSTIGDDRHGIRQSIVARLERHGGAAQIHSTIGVGTELELSVPRRSADAAARSPSTSDLPADESDAIQGDDQ